MYIGSIYHNGDGDKVIEAIRIQELIELDYYNRAREGKLTIEEREFLWEGVDDE